MAVDWIAPSPENDEGFMLKLPWLSMEVDVSPEDKGWIQDAIATFTRIPGMEMSKGSSRN